MRPKQWVKNSFVMAPLLFSGAFLSIAAINQSLIAAFIFCLASSATYILNDICDVEYDRCHPKKSKNRPLVSGIVSIPTAKLLLGVVYSILVLGWFISPRIMPVIAIYLAFNFAYTLILKYQPVVDIFSIAIGFVLRVYAGSVALAVPASNWMFITTLCLALYLAAIKRRQEIVHSGTKGRKVLKNYSVSLIDRYAEMSATGALVFYSMFVMSAKPELIITIPLVLFGLFRYWYMVEKLDKGESPTDTLLSDWQLLLTIVLSVGCCGWMLRLT